jgi:hypothetical protein
MVESLGKSTFMGNGAKDALARAASEGHGDEMVSQMVDSFSRWFAD